MCQFFHSTKAALTHLRKFVWNLYHSTRAQHSSMPENLGEFWMPDKALIGAWVVAGISMVAILLPRRLAEPCKLWWTNKLDKDNKQARKQKPWENYEMFCLLLSFVTNPMRIDNSNLFLGLTRKADGLEIKCKKEASLLWQLIEQRQRAAGSLSGTNDRRSYPIVVLPNRCLQEPQLWKSCDKCMEKSWPRRSFCCTCHRKTCNFSLLRISFGDSRRWWEIWLCCLERVRTQPAWQEA